MSGTTQQAMKTTQTTRRAFGPTTNQVGIRSVSLALGLALVLGLAACSNKDDDDGPTAAPLPPPVATVPDSAGVSVASFISFLLSLSASDESTEPLLIKDLFAVPADETSEPQTLT